MFNMLDFASYLPMLGKLTSTLGESSHSYESPSAKLRNKSQRSRRKKEKVVLIKKPIYPGENSSYSNVNQLLHAKRRKTCLVRRKLKKNKGKKLSKTQESAEGVPISTDSNLGNMSQDVLVAIEDFRVKRDQFVRSLHGLQKKLLSFEIPDFFKQQKEQNSKEEIKSPSKRLSSTQKREETKNKSSKNKRHRKQVRSVSQHFFLADMTESDKSKSRKGSSKASSSSSSSSPSSSTEDSQKREAGGDSSEMELANQKVKKYLEDLGPTERRKSGNERKSPILESSLKNGIKKRKTDSKTVDVYWNRLSKRLGDLARAPVKEEESKQRRVKSETIGERKTHETISSEFERLKKASEDKLRDKFEKRVRQ